VISPVRSAKYQKYVRGQRCAFCARPATEAHHTGRLAGGGGVGIKPCDYLAAPLCRSHHQEIHDTGAIRDLSPEQTEYGLWKAIALTLRAYHLQETA
jgi:hypothetical protein